MKLKMKVVSLFCVLAMVAGIAVPAFAATQESAPTRPNPVSVVEVEEPENIVYTTEVTAGNGEEADGDMPFSFVSEGVDETGIEPRDVSISRDFDVPVGSSWSYSFDTGKWFADDHNAFKTIVSNVSGKYKILITDTHGYEYSTNEFSNVGVTITTTNAFSDKVFTVYILNTGTSKLTGHVKISSFYNE